MWVATLGGMATPIAAKSPLTSEGAESFLEEMASTIVHGVGLGLSVPALVVLVVLASNGQGAEPIVAVSIYGSCLILLYLGSTLYHAIWHHQTKRALLVFDHCTIFLLIAGTYTPVTLIALPEPVGWWLFGLIWALALFGIVRVLVRRHMKPAVLLYLTMGWLGVLFSETIVEAIGAAGAALLLAGGITYTVGLAFFGWRRLPFNHAVWHLFVVGGSACHFCAIAFFALPA